MSRAINAVAVFRGAAFETAKLSDRDAREAARILGGTDWQARGYTVEPVLITRAPRATTRTAHPDMIDER